MASLIVIIHTHCCWDPCYCEQHKRVRNTRHDHECTGRRIPNCCRGPAPRWGTSRFACVCTPSRGTLPCDRACVCARCKRLSVDHTAQQCRTPLRTMMLSSPIQVCRRPRLLMLRPDLEEDWRWRPADQAMRRRSRPTQGTRIEEAARNAA